MDKSNVTYYTELLRVIKYLINTENNVTRQPLMEILKDHGGCGTLLMRVVKYLMVPER